MGVDVVRAIVVRSVGGCGYGQGYGCKTVGVALCQSVTTEE